MGRVASAVLGIVLAASVALSARGQGQPESRTDPPPGRNAAASAGRWEPEARAAEGRGDARRAAEAWLRVAEDQQSRGDYGLAVATLDRAIRFVEAHGADPSLLAALRGARGNLYIAVARPEDARKELEAALVLARGAKADSTAATISNNLGNHFAATGDLEAAERAYLESAKGAEGLGDFGLAARALANAARTRAERGDVAGTRAFAERARTRLEVVAPSPAKAALLLHLARSLDRVRTAEPSATDPAEERDALLEVRALLGQAEAMAAEQGDSRTAAYALGDLARLYGDRGRNAEALELTSRAIAEARRADAPEIRYALHARAGRLLERTGDRDAAITELATAVELLQSIRFTMSVRYGSEDPSFQDRVGGVYFDYVDLLLRRAADSEAPEADLALAQQTLERLKAAELRDYFRDECVDQALEGQVSAAEASPTAAVLYPVLLPDRIELLVSTARRSWRTSVPVGREEATVELRRLRRLLERRITREYLRPARRVHDWLIAPVAAELEKEGIDALVFVPDGALRSVPMAALHDGERFLVERFAIAITPSLRLTDPRPIDRERVRVFAGGVSEAVQGHTPLPHVREELARVGSVFESEVLLDEQFERATLEVALRNEAFSIVHIASHASFDPDAEQTYVLTHDGKLSMDDLASYVGLFRFREQPLDLLMLSACETAAGDERAALGLSGLAVKAGARSAAGTLWSVDDEASSRLVARFYENLKDPALSRAEALRRAQRTLIADPDYAHPAYWSAFVLISDWL